MPGLLVIALTISTAAASDAPGVAPPAPVEAGALRLEPPAVPPPQEAGARAAEPRLSLSLDHPGAASAAGQEPEEARIARLRRWERVLKWSTAGSLVVTTTLGTFAAINQPTAFGDGRCQTGGPVLGTYGCDRGLSTLHGASAVLSATLYTADG